MCSAISPGCRYDINFIKTYCERVLCEYNVFGCTLGERKISILPLEATINVFKARPRIRDAFLSDEHTNSFSWSVTKVHKILKRHKNQLKVILGMSIVHEGFVPEKMCLCPVMVGEWWKLLRMSAMQSVLPRFEHSF